MEEKKENPSENPNGLDEEMEDLESLQSSNADQDSNEEQPDSQDDHIEVPGANPFLLDDVDITDDASEDEEHDRVAPQSDALLNMTLKLLDCNYCAAAGEIDAASANVRNWNLATRCSQFM
jgi:hypothetical protein